MVELSEEIISRTIAVARGLAKAWSDTTNGTNQIIINFKLYDYDKELLS